MTSLQINVREVVTIVDTLPQFKEVIAKIVNDWFLSDDKEPLAVTLTKIEARGPPALGISVGDSITVRHSLR